MTRIDLFAAAALQGLLAGGAGEEPDAEHVEGGKWVIRKAWELAKAMVDEEDGGEPGEER